MPAHNIRSIALALGGKVAGRDFVRVPGPGHSRKDRSLSVTFSGDFFICNSFAGDDWRECRDHVKSLLGWSDDEPWPVANDNTPPPIDIDSLKKQNDALSIWSRSVPIEGTLAETYLHSRGLSYQGDALRFYRGGRAMVGLMTDAITGEPTGIHRTFLDCDGRKIDKKMLGPAKGAVVRLSADEDVNYGLAIAEGIETALAAPFRPIWSCLSAGGIRDFPVLSGIECLTVFADNDASGTGLAAAKTCAERWHASHREAIIHIPTDTGVDFATGKAVA